MAASKFRDQKVLTAEGQSGRLVDLLIGDDGEYLAAVDFGRDHGLHEVPLRHLAYEDDHFLLRNLGERDLLSLPTFLEGRLRSVEPETLVDVKNYRATEDASIFVQQPPAQVKVERPALAIHWQQPAPQVTVHQAAPHVNVRQMRPVILVRQPPPVITVEMAQPEIIVKMPQPDVDVSLAEAEVQVSVPRPDVQVMQPAQPMVDFHAAEPVVSLLPRESADVSIERAEPLVRYERMGEPRVVFRAAEGSPRITFEEISRDEALGFSSEASASGLRGGVADASAGAGRSGTDATSGGSAATGSTMTGASGQSMDGPGTASSSSPLAGGTMLSADLEGREVFDTNGTRVGHIGGVMVDPQGSIFLVLERGGFLGRKRLLSLDRFALSSDDDRLVVWNLTDHDIRRMADWDESIGSYAPAASDSPVNITHGV
jgi:hypothetical protein